MQWREADLMYTPFRSRLYRLVPWMVRALVPGERPGSYSLFNTGGIVYTGRSDTDLRRRLLQHAHDRRADFFDYDALAGPRAAFLTECATYHAVGATLTNRIHPGSPAGKGEECPFCRPRLLETIRGRLSPEAEQ